MTIDDLGHLMFVAARGHLTVGQKRALRNIGRRILSTGVGVRTGASTVCGLLEVYLMRHGVRREYKGIPLRWDIAASLYARDSGTIASRIRCDSCFSRMTACADCIHASSLAQGMAGQTTSVLRVIDRSPSTLDMRAAQASRRDIIAA